MLRNGCDETACYAAVQMGRLACTDAQTYDRQNFMSKEADRLDCE